MSPQELQELHDRIAPYLTEIKQKVFKGHMHITFLARDPKDPECEVLLTTDDLDGVMFAIKRAKRREKSE